MNILILTDKEKKLLENFYSTYWQNRQDLPTVRREGIIKAAWITAANGSRRELCRFYRKYKGQLESLQAAVSGMYQVTLINQAHDMQEPAPMMEEVFEGLKVVCTRGFAQSLLKAWEVRGK